MNPKDCKGKRVAHTPTNKSFVVVGGAKKSGAWYLKDEYGALHLFDECRLTIESDVIALKSFTELSQLIDFHALVGSNCFNEAWTELEKNPVDAASVALLYCDNWTEFCGIVEEYGVSEKQSATLNKKFKDLLREKGLAKTVSTWYNRRAA